MKCKLCNQTLVIVNIDGTKACTNPKCDIYSGKDLTNAKHPIKKIEKPKKKE